MYYRDRVNEIVKEQTEIVRQLKELNLIYVASLKEEGLCGDHEVSERYATAIRQLEEQFNALTDEYKTTAPCFAFEERFGQQAHDVYRERHPINMETKVQGIGDFKKQPRRWAYGIPQKPLWEVPNAQHNAQWENAPVTSLHTFETEFEEWGFPEAPGRYGIRVYLAFAPEINTVFIGRQERRDAGMPGLEEREGE